MSQRKAGTLLTYLHIFLSNTISLVYTPYMLRMMGQSEYGLYGTASSFISYLSILNFGIGGAYLRFNARYRAVNDREGEKRLNGMFLIVFSFLSLLVFIGGMVCVLFAGKIVEDTFTIQELTKLRIIMILLTVNMMVTFVFNVVSMALQAYEKYFFIRIVMLISAIVTPLINVIALKIGGRAITISAISLATSILCYLAYFIYARKSIHMEFSFKGVQKDVMKEIFVFSGYMFLNSITDQITFSTDTIILSAIKGTSAVAIYTVGANFKNYFQQLASAVSGVFGPMLNLMVAQDKSVKALDEVFIKVGRVQFYVVSLVMIGYLSIGKDFVRMWAGENYVDAYYIGLMLMIAVFVPSFQSVGLEIQKAMNKHKVRSIVYFMIAIVNVIITIPFSKMWAGIGAALATMISMFLGRVLFMNYYNGRYIGLDIKEFWKVIASILPGYIIPCILACVVNHYWAINSYMDIMLSAMVISLTFFVSIWMFSMNTYEKELVASIFRKLKICK